MFYICAATVAQFNLVMSIINLNFVKIVMKLFRFFKEKIDPKIGSTVVHFTTHGFMGEIHKLDYIGTLVNTGKREHCGNTEFYKVKLHADGKSNEARNGIELIDKWVADHYLQFISPGLYFAYD